MSLTDIIPPLPLGYVIRRTAYRGVQNAPTWVITRPDDWYLTDVSGWQSNVFWFDTLAEASAAFEKLPEADRMQFERVPKGIAAAR
jgi:hypothetical protein